MYDDSMTAIHNHLIQKSITGNFLYTAELIPERDSRGGEVYVPQATAFSAILIEGSAHGV